MNDKPTYRLNYEISSWLPKDSIWTKQSNGNWERQDGSHTVGNATESVHGVYWFALLLDQESTEPSGTRSTLPIISKVQRREIWVEVDDKDVSHE